MGDPLGVLLRCTKFRVERIAHRAADGRTHTREIVRHAGAVAIVPLVDEDHVCLIKTVRPAVARELIEIPAGTRETAEPPEETARRELAEETGYRAGRIRLLSRCFSTPGISDEELHLFAAFDLTAGEPSREQGEEIQNLVVTWEEAMQRVLDGSIADAKTIAGILLWNQLRDRKRN